VGFSDPHGKRDCFNRQKFNEVQLQLFAAGQRLANLTSQRVPGRILWRLYRNQTSIATIGDGMCISIHRYQVIPLIIYRIQWLQLFFVANG
jgi:hypothetical protein